MNTGPSGRASEVRLRHEEAAVEAGANGYLRKPFDSEEAETVLRSFLPAW